MVGEVIRVHQVLDEIQYITVVTPDNRFFRLHKRGELFRQEFLSCCVGSKVEWEGTTYFKVRKIDG
jgi:hypothetical protein